MKNFDPIIKATLKEDNTSHDITSKLSVSANCMAEARIFVKENTTLCGVLIAKRVFQLSDKSLKVSVLKKDGQKLTKGTTILKLKGRARSILKAERVALNFLGHLSGISTKTSLFVSAIKPFKAKILDTRKTTPLLREMQRFAVECGGGVNHRFDLSQMVLIKDNHRALSSSNATLVEIIKRAKKSTRKKIEVEVDTLKEFKSVLTANPDFILLDNMSNATMKRAVQLKKQAKSKTQLEASGGITLKNVKSVVATGVERISLGTLTHTIKNIDFSLELKKC